MPGPFLPAIPCFREGASGPDIYSGYHNATWFIIIQIFSYSFILFQQQDDDDVLECIKELAPKPTIIIMGSQEAPSEVMVAAEKQVICQIMDKKVLNAYVCFMAICYVFMFHYPPSIKNFCLYLQKCVLQIRDGKKLPTSIISFINDIYSLVSKVSL